MQNYTFIRFFSLCVFLLCAQATAADRSLTKPTKEEREAAFERARKPMTVVVTEPIDYDTTHFGHIPPIINRKKVLIALISAASLLVLIQTYRHDETASQRLYY